MASVMSFPVDRFGFPLLALSADEQSSRKVCIAREAQCGKRWERVQANGLPVDHDALIAALPRGAKQLVRDGGIPRGLRPQLWLILSGGAALQAAAPSAHHFHLLITQPGFVLDLAEVSREVAHAFPGHQFLATPFGIAAVRRLVMAYGRHSPEAAARAGTPSLVCVAGLLLAVMGLGREEEAFWTLTGLVNTRLPASCLQDTRGCTVEQHVLAELLAKRCPRLTALFHCGDLEKAALTATWFPRLFTTTLPAETAVRVWDCLLVEGPKVLFRVALALLKRNEGIVLGHGSPEQVIRNLRWRLARTYNVDDLLKAAFKGIGSLPMAVIVRTRSGYEDAVTRQIEEQQRRLAAVLAGGKLSVHSTTPSDASSCSETCPLAAICEDEEPLL